MQSLPVQSICWLSASLGLLPGFPTRLSSCFSFNVSGYVAETAPHPVGNTFHSLRAARDSFLLCQPSHHSKHKHPIF